jgi:hypothetical protein
MQRRARYISINASSTELSRYRSLFEKRFLRLKRLFETAKQPALRVRLRRQRRRAPAQGLPQPAVLKTERLEPRLESTWNDD